MVVVLLAVYYGHALTGGVAPIWLAVALPTALEISRVRSGGTYASWLMMALPAALALWLESSGSSVPYKGFPAILSAATAVPFLLGLRRSGPQPYLLLLALQVGLVAYFSSGQGGSGAMVRWLEAHGLNDSAAHEATLAFRKCVHFTFYGSVGWVVLRAVLATNSPTGEAVRTGLLAALSVATFDEFRQSSYANRTGSAWDVLLDLSGAAVFIGLSVVRHRRRTIK